MPTQKALSRVRDWKCRQVYDVCQSGSDRQRLFDQPANCIHYLDRLDLYARRYKVRIHALCLMAHEVRFLLEPLRRGAISSLMQQLQGHHARYMNRVRGAEGHLYRAHFRAKHVANHAAYCAALLSIEKSCEENAYSSAAAHAANRPVLTVTHDGHRAQVNLYLDRWREEFGFSDEGEIAWDTWLQGRHYAANAPTLRDRLPPAKASGDAVAMRYRYKAKAASA